MTQLTASPPSDAAKLDAACAKGMELQLAGQLEGASGLYEAVLQASPGHPAANYCLGMLLVQSQRAVDALPYLKAALLAGLEVPDYWLGYLEALILAGRTTAARNTLALGCQHGLAGAAVEDLARRLEVKLAEGAAPPAAKITAPAPMAPEQAPPPPAAARLAGPPAAPAKRAPSGRKGEQLARKEEDRLLSLLGSPDKAQILALARGLTERFPQRGLGWKILGAFMSTEGGLEEALPVLEKAVRLLPNDAEAHVNLGVTLAKTKSFKEAEAHLRTALRLDP